MELGAEELGRGTAAWWRWRSCGQSWRQRRGATDGGRCQRRGGRLEEDGGEGIERREEMRGRWGSGEGCVTAQEENEGRDGLGLWRLGLRGAGWALELRLQEAQVVGWGSLSSLSLIYF